MKPNIPLTWMTRQLKEMVEKEGADAPEQPGGGDSSTLTRRPRAARDDSTLKRHHTIGMLGLIPSHWSLMKLGHYVAAEGDERKEGCYKFEA